MTNKLYTKWWVWVILGLSLLLMISLFSGGNNQLIDEQQELILEQQNTINQMNETIIKEYQIINKLQTDYEDMCGYRNTQARLVNIFIDVYDPDGTLGYTRQMILDCYKEVN